MPYSYYRAAFSADGQACIVYSLGPNMTDEQGKNELQQDDSRPYADDVAVQLP